MKQLMCCQAGPTGSCNLTGWCETSDEYCVHAAGTNFLSQECRRCAVTDLALFAHHAQCIWRISVQCEAVQQVTQHLGSETADPVLGPIEIA